MEEERMEQPRRRRKPKSFFRRLLELPKKTLLTLVAILVVFVAVIVIISKSCSAVPDTTVTAQAFSTQTELHPLPAAADAAHLQRLRHDRDVLEQLPPPGRPAADGGQRRTGLHGR